MSINNNSLYNKACDLYNKEKYKEAFNIFISLAKENDKDAQNSVAEMYIDGIGIFKNKEEAKYWWNKAIQLDNINAAYELGRLNIVEGNIEEGIMLLKKASNCFHVEAMYLLAGYYYYGKLVDKNLNKALVLYKKSSQLGHKLATKDYVRVVFVKYGKWDAIKHIARDLWDYCFSHSRGA